MISNYLMWGLLQKISHFLFRRFSSMQNVSKCTGEEYRPKGKMIMPSFTSNIIPPPLSFRSILFLVQYTWMKNWFAGKVTFNFVSLIMRISILPPMSDENNSNLFLTELILRCTTIILLEYLTRRFFSPKIISHWCSSGAALKQIVSDSGLRLS